MALILKVPFVSGSVYTPEIATEMSGVTFDDLPQYYGHYSKVADTDLSDAPGSIKTRVAVNETNLKVTAGAGLNANYAAGRALYGTTVLDFTASSIALVASATNYIHVNTNGVIVNTTSLPPILRALLATVTTNTTGIVTVVDNREGYKVEVIKPLATTVKNFGGRGDSGAFIAAGGETLSDGEYYFTDFTVGAGRTITVDKLARIYCTGAMTISGTVNVTAATAGGAALAGAYFGSTTTPCIYAGGAGAGVGGGNGETPAPPYNHLISPVGSGGGSGYTSKDSFGQLGTRVGGKGGGCFWAEVAGNISISGLILALGTDGEAGFHTDPGPGGRAATGGGGGGSGGLILLKALGSIVVSGILDVTGGFGGAGVLGNSNCSAECGSGGGGGRIVIFSTNINTTGSLLKVPGGGTGAFGTVGSTVCGYGGVGGSYGGSGGTQLGNGASGTTGVLITRAFTPIG